MLLSAWTLTTPRPALATTWNLNLTQICTTTPLTHINQVLSTNTSWKITSVETCTHKPTQWDAKLAVTTPSCQTVPEWTSHATDQEMTGSSQAMSPNTQKLSPAITNTFKTTLRPTRLMELQVSHTGGQPTWPLTLSAQDPSIAQIGDIITKSHTADKSNFWRVSQRSSILTSSQSVLRPSELMSLSNNNHTLTKPSHGPPPPTKRNGNINSTSITAPRTSLLLTQLVATDVDNHFLKNNGDLNSMPQKLLDLTLLSKIKLEELNSLVLVPSPLTVWCGNQKDKRKDSGIKNSANLTNTIKSHVKDHAAPKIISTPQWLAHQRMMNTFSQLPQKLQAVSTTNKVRLPSSNESNDRYLLYLTLKT